MHSHSSAYMHPIFKHSSLPPSPSSDRKPLESFWILIDKLEACLKKLQRKLREARNCLKGRSVEGSSAPDCTSSIEEKKQPFVVPTIGVPSATDATTMGDPPT
ncbi:hypothetical protein QL285_064354 [Trifolium repens]|nr:hypothetical protein QL285_064354 [Trifolium repens]